MGLGLGFGFVFGFGSGLGFGLDENKNQINQRHLTETQTYVGFGFGLDENTNQKTFVDERRHTKTTPDCKSFLNSETPLWAVYWTKDKFICMRQSVFYPIK
jgi:hypothetical protein